MTSNTAETQENNTPKDSLPRDLYCALNSKLIEEPSQANVHTPIPDKTSPNWKVWKQRNDVMLWKAVSLSKNIEPSKLQIIKKNQTKRYEHYQTRLETAISWLENDLPIQRNHPANGFFIENSVVRLAEFVQCALSKEMRITPRLLAIFSKEDTPSRSAHKVAVDSQNTDIIKKDWTELARECADECFDHDTNATPPVRDSLAQKKGKDIVGGYSFRAMELMQQRGVKGPRGTINNAATIMRDALQGDKWWAKKQK